MTPGSMVTRFCSTIREMPNVAAIVIGKMAAGVPRNVPSTSCVSGAIAVMKMMNGIGRMKFTTTFSTVEERAVLQQAAAPGRVEQHAEREAERRRRARGSPTTIQSVWPMDSRYTGHRVDQSVMRPPPRPR